LIQYLICYNLRTDSSVRKPANNSTPLTLPLSQKLSSMISRNYFRTTTKYLQSLLNLMITTDL